MRGILFLKFTGILYGLDLAIDQGHWSCGIPIPVLICILELIADSDQSCTLVYFSRQKPSF